MSELIAAAKAVIDNWDRHWPLDSLLNRLKSAVERAEKQESKPWTKPIPADFKEWWETYALNKYGMGPAYHAWSAGQQAERMRIKDLLKQSSDWFEDGQMAQANWLLEKIDATTE